MSVADVLAVAGLLLGLAGFATALSMLWRSRRHRLGAPAGVGARSTELHFEPAVLRSRAPRQRAPVPPPALVDACAAGDCVLVTGTGLSAPLGLPTWREALLELLRLCEQREPDNPIWGQLRGELGEQQYELVADFLRVRLGAERMRAMLREVIGPARAANVRRMRRLHGGLLAVPFAGVVSTGWDTTVTELFGDREAIELDLESNDEFAAVLRGGGFFVLRAFGSLRDDTLLLTTEQLQLHLDDHAAYARFLGSIFATRTLLFVGTGVAGIEDFLRACGLRGGGDRRHFALAPWSGEAELHRERLAARYGVELLLYDPEGDHRQVSEFGEALAAATSPDPRRRVSAPSRRAAGALTHVRLSHIGPFEHLELDLAAGWSVLLGDNGCGKSSVLRAIALALSGDDDRAVQAAGRLLNSEQRVGEIELAFDGVTVSTRLVREGTRVRVVSGQYSPVQAGACLALGFPPLRGVSLGTARDPTSSVPAGPGVDDLLPLVTGVVDPRLDDLRHWILLSFYEQVGDWSAGAVRGAKAPDVVARFFATVSALLPQDDFAIEFERVDRRSREVFVRTPDGVIPMSMLSQGMSSTLAWIGTVLARVDEVRRSGVRTDGLPALVLVDEIDAHLHPRWQREIVDAVSAQLPGVQLVATTHSPLVVGSVGAARLWHLRRDAQGVHARCVDHDYRGWRTDQILAAPPFGTSPRDTGTEALLDAYQQLAARDELTAEEREQLDLVAGELDIRLPSAPERAEARTARELIEHAARERIDAIPADERERVLQELRLQVQEAITRSGRRT